MKKINLEVNKLEKIILGKIGNTYMELINNISINDMKPLAYTSFDGDFLSHSELMKQFVFKKNMVPLNPESALGTYLVTNYYNGEKSPIIKDCLKLLSICDIFLVMSNLNFEMNDKIDKLSEGVLAEIFYWCKNKNHKVGIVDIKDYQFIQNIEVNLEHLALLHPLQKNGIEKIIETDLNSLRKTVYLLSGEKHAKHSDWLRLDAYKNQKIPLCPYTLYNMSSLNLAYGNDEISKLISRISLSLKADEIWIYGILKDTDFNFSKLEIDLLIEIYLNFKLNLKKPKIIYKYFGEVGIPKYINTNKWAITDFEKVYHT